MSKARVLKSLYKALNRKFKSQQWAANQGAARSAAGKAQSVASASAGLRKPVPTLSVSTRNALKIGRRQVAAQQGVHHKRAIMPDYMHGMHGVRKRAVSAYGSVPNPLGPKVKATRKRRTKKRKSRS